MLKIPVMIIIILFTAAGFMSAQEENEIKKTSMGISFGPQLGWQKSSSADNGSLMFGAALRLRVSESLGLEGSINYRSEDYADGGLTVRTWPIMITGLVYPLQYFYGAIGIGWYNTSFDYENQSLAQTFENNTQQNFGWHLGAGLEVPATSTIKVTGDIRYVFLNYDFGDLEQAINSGDLISNFFVISLGVQFQVHM